MKKILIAVLVIAVTFALVGCGKKPSGGDATAAPDSGANSAASDKVGISKEEGHIVFKVSSEFKLDENCWMGIVPAGREYRKELDADEVDVIWTGREYYDPEVGGDYTFIFYPENISDIEDGGYAMVLCDNDDEGAVILQFPIEVKGAELTADLSKLKVY